MIGNNKLRAILILVTVALSVYVFFYKLGERSLIGDEAAHAVVSRCILKHKRLYPLCTESFITNRSRIYCGGKEPLKFWLEALLFRFAPINEWTARIIDAVLGMATILFLLFVGGSLLGWETGVLASLMVLSFPPIILSHCFRSGTQDSMLVFSYTVAIVGYLWYRLRGSNFALFMATLAVIAGLMTKDVFLLSVYPSVMAGEAAALSRNKFSKNFVSSGFFFFLLVPVLWYFSWLSFAYFTTHGICLKHLIKKEFVGPALGEVAKRATHYKGPFFYLNVLSKYIGSVFFVLILFIILAIRSSRGMDDRAKSAIFLLIASLCYLFLISIPRFKMIRYIYPIYPVLALGLAFCAIVTFRIAASRFLKLLIVLAVGVPLIVNFSYISSKIITENREVPSKIFLRYFQSISGPKVFIIDNSWPIGMGSHDNYYLSFVPNVRRMSENEIKRALETRSFKGTLAILTSHPAFYKTIQGFYITRIWDMRKRRKEKREYVILEAVEKPYHPQGEKG